MIRSALAGGSLLMLAACGGGGGGGVNSASNDVPTSSATTTTTTTTTTAATTTSTVNYNDAEYQRSSGANSAGALTAYQSGATGSGQTVAIIDTGIATSSSEFTGRIASASRDVAGNSSIVDTDGHGTAVAGVLAAARNGSGIQGVAFNATILALRTDTPGTCASSDGCAFSSANIAAGLDVARINGAKVVNISLGGASATPQLVNAIDRATAAGMIVVIAAGNDGATNPDPLPQVAASSSARGLVIIAGSINPDGSYASFADKAGTFGTYFLSALGSQVRSFDHTGTAYYYQGTSFSTPIIAGAIALLQQAFPNLTPAQIVALLYSSATDAGAAGVDNVYGRGVLNIAKAFSPQGTTSLAGSQVAVTGSEQTVLSSAMGDAALSSKSAGQAIVLDALGRAYTMDVSANLTRRAVTRPLVQAIGDYRSTSQQIGPFAFSATVARGFSGRPWAGMALGNRGFDQSIALRPVNGSATVKIDANTSAAFAFAQQGRSLSDSLLPSNPGNFLAARRIDDTPGFVARTGMSFALLHRFGQTTLTATAERGTVPATSLTDTQTPSYAIMGVRAQRLFGQRLQIGLGVSSLREAATVLGARLSPAFGRSGATTRYIDLDARLALIRGWSLGAAWRSGWTRTESGGVLDHSSIASRSASADVAYAGNRSRFALRVSLPQRVMSGGLSLLLPTSYDYATGAVGFSPSRIGLTPRGTERDVEASYGFHIGAGWMDSNLFWRRQPGNIQALPDDFGTALRYSLTF